MNDEIVVLLAGSFVGAVNGWAYMAQRFDRHPGGQKNRLMLAASDGFLFAVDIRTGYHINAAVDGSMAVIWLHAWWKNRPPKKRKPSKILAKVRERLGKLVIVNG